MQASINGSLITYQVYDPGRNTFASGSANTPASYISTPTTNGGVVAWLAGSTVYYRIYDPGRSNWVGGSATASGLITDPTSDSGLVAWLGGTAIYFAAYDPVAGRWTNAAISNAGATAISNPKNSGGVIAWNADQTVWCVTYDPVLRGWAYTSYFMGAGAYISDIEVSTGVAAWLANNTAYFVVYDTTRAAWRPGTGSGRFTESIAIGNSTVSWVAGGISYSAGYTYSNAAWTTGIQTPTHSGFLVSRSSGDAPLFVWFTDLSLGGSSWSWNFGDGNTATGRIPYHVFNGFGRYAVLQTVAGSTPSSTSSTNVLTDTAAPSGSMVINNDDPYARTNRVTLTLSVSDNSGMIALMRFSNTNGVNWSDWVPYATNYPWILAPGADGIRSVYGQFMDPSSNISLTIFDSITLDTRPPPLAYTTNYLVNESTPSLQVSVLLSDTSVFPVFVDFATSDGTATGGHDYGSTNGHLRFNPGVTNQSFTLFITNDTLVELNETIFIVLSNPTNATVAAPGTVTILDDDSPLVSFATNNFRIDEYAGQALISVNLNFASGRTNYVNYATSNGTATAGSDYSAVSGTLVFAPGQISRSFVVPILDDTVDEPDETVLLYLSSPTNALLGAQSTATLAIIDDDPPPASFTTNMFFTGGSAGAAMISVRLNTPFAQTVLVDYTTSDGTAHAGADYVATSGTLVFGSGETIKSFFVNILNNPSRRTSETVRLGFTGLNNATPGLFTNATLMIAGPPRLASSSWATNAGFHCTISGFPGEIYAVQMSTNVAQGWSELLRLTNVTGTVGFSDPAALGNKRRFYRASSAN